jgi:hypothetical protein
MRVYRLQNALTGDFLVGIGRAYVETKTKGKISKKLENVPLWSEEGNYMPIENINTIILDALKTGCSSALDEVEIKTYKTRDPYQITSSIKTHNIRKRLEADLIMEKLKGANVVDTVNQD